MGRPAEPIAPTISTLGLLFAFTFTAVVGHVRDLLCFLFYRTGKSATKKGYAPVKSGQEDFYNRRMYHRLLDCYNRPIGSAPDAWIDVLERTDITGTSGMHVTQLQLTGQKRRCLNLGSYNYLGFAAADEYCTPRVLETLEQYGVSTCSPRTDAGTTAVHQELEKLVAEYVGCEDAVTYGMGFAVNSTTIPALAGKGTLIVSDALNHASIVAGARISGAKVKVFRHNDAKHLEAVLRHSIAEGQPRTHRPWKKILVIVEGIYSMEGEACNLKEIVEVKKKYKAYLYLDEAHSIGALGKTGRGCCEHAGVDPRDVDVMMGTFTKSFGSCGGYIAGKKSLIDYLRRHTPAHLYATSMSPAAVQQVISAIKLINGDDGTNRGQMKIQQLHDNANYFRKRLVDMGLDVLGTWDSPVMPIMCYHPGKMPVLSRLCLQHHIATVVVGFPATAMLLTRARVCISAAHTREDLDYALEVLDHVAEITLLKYRNKELYHKAVTEYEEYLGSKQKEKEAELTASKAIAAKMNGLANGKANGIVHCHAASL